jgi:aromatic ring-cleaving dioxygenase
MFRATYTSENQSVVEDMITAQRNGLSVLLHESINNDLRDHTEGARWLGEPVALDLEWLATNQDQVN